MIHLIADYKFDRFPQTSTTSLCFLLPRRTYSSHKRILVPTCQSLSANHTYVVQLPLLITVVYTPGSKGSWRQSRDTMCPYKLTRYENEVTISAHASEVEEKRAKRFTRIIRKIRSYRLVLLGKFIIEMTFDVVILCLTRNKFGNDILNASFVVIYIDTAEHEFARAAAIVVGKNYADAAPSLSRRCSCW